jgi:ABC-type dipeptide/oligopeptide/nickel transport system permease component
MGRILLGYLVLAAMTVFGFLLLSLFIFEPVKNTLNFQTVEEVTRYESQARLAAWLLASFVSYLITIRFVFQHAPSKSKPS